MWHTGREVWERRAASLEADPRAPGLTSRVVGEAFVHYGGLALFKGAVFVLFLVPYVAIRIVLWRDRR